MLHLSCKRGYKKPEPHYCIHLYEVMIEQSRSGFGYDNPSFIRS